jgi:predicted RNA-binding protein with PUA-like domain
MKAMQIGDLAFFCHSVDEKQIVGIVEICARYHPDPTDASGRFGMMTVRAVKPLNTPVTLTDISKLMSVFKKWRWYASHDYR